MKQTIILLLILLVGCNKEETIECQNITITNTIETIKYINVTIEEPCNTSKEREIELIRRIKFLEKNQDELIINEIECDNSTITNYKDKLDMCERDLEEVEDELEECEDEICEYNSSWC